MIKIDDLKNVRGIGPKAIEEVERYVEELRAVGAYSDEVSNTPSPDKMSIELNSIYAGEASAFMAENIPDNTIDLTVTSPPYDNLRDYEGYMFNAKDIAKQLHRITSDGGVVVWVVGDATINGSETGTSFKQALDFMDVGFRLHDTMIYEKNTSSFPARRNGNRYTQIFEYMFVFSKGAPKVANLISDKPNKWAGHTNWGENTHRGKDGHLVTTDNIKAVPDYSPRNNIWRYIVGGGFATKDKIAHQHPAIFPEKLARDHILSWSNEGDIVFDPMCGSGTTCKVAKELGRSYIGCDISGEYVKLAKERIQGTNRDY